MGGAKKKLKKIIPKEIKPALPFVAAAFGAPYLAGSSFMTSAISNPFVRNLVAKGITSAATSKATGADTKQALRSGILAAAPDVLAKGLGSAGRALGNIRPESKLAQTLVSKGTGLETTLAKPGLDMATAKVIGGQTAIEAGQRAIELNEKALRDYEAQLREQGIMDSSERRNKIFGYFTRAGYGAEETNAMLDKYGYAYGGRVGYKEGGGIQALIDYLKEKEDEEDEFNLGKFSSGLEGIKSGFEMATGQPLMGSKPQPTRFGLAEGGIPNIMAMRKTIAELIASGVIDEEDVEEAVAQIKNQAMMSMRAPGMADGGMMNLRAGGMPAEMDMRGGGFIPIGKKERADDVPARLSKNEFVMTADAVRAAGGGSINKGAKRMYDLMNKLESKV
jgi:hypothetical protein